MALSYYEMVEAVRKGVDDVIEKAFNDINEVFERDAQVKIPLNLTLTAAGPGGQVDVLLEIKFLANGNEKPPPFNAQWIKGKKRIRLNPAQKPLPGQGE